MPVLAPRVPPAPEIREGMACGVREIPGLQDRAGLQAMLGQLMSETGATRAELRVGESENGRPMVELGPAMLMR